MTLELRNICLRYSKKIVLQNLNLVWKGAQLHALLGENGAGKSTLANIICGELRPDSGELFLDGETVLFKTPRDAIEKGICYVHQTPMLADSISVYENLLLGIKKEYQPNIASVAKMWIPKLPLKTPVKSLSGGMRFFVALCSALIKNPRLLILDEPTALLDEEQKAFLFENLQLLAHSGMNIILITHYMDEAEKYCDTIDFLEEGKLTPKKNLPVLTDAVKKLKQKELTARMEKGKITLVQGQAEDGLGELEKKLITDALKNNRRQCAIIPTDRKYTASNPNLSILQLLTSALDIPQSQKPAAALKMIKNAGVNITPFEKCKSLSGGMLQKLLIEREFYNEPQTLLLCNPLQGLDSATCTKICERIKQAADNGASVMVLSYGAFPPELCDIHYILRHGKMEAV